VRSQPCDFGLSDLYELLFPSEENINGYMCMVYHSYLDDSKDRGAKRVIVSAGFCATKEIWEAFRLDWKRKLKEHRLCYFKSSECHSVNGEFTSLRKSGKSYATTEERKRAREIRGEFLSVVRKHPLIRAIGVAIQVEDYSRYAALPEVKDILPVDPYKAALSSVMFETVNHIRSIPGHNVVAFVHDEQEPFDELQKCYLAFKEMNKKTREFVGGFAPMDDKKTPELQAADLIANHTTYLAGRKLDLKDAAVEMRENISLLGVWDEGFLVKLLKSTLRKHGHPLPLEIEGIP